MNILKVDINLSALEETFYYINSLNYLPSFNSSDNATAVQRIKDLLVNPNERPTGLMLLKTALEQNVAMHAKGNWPAILSDILKDSGSYILKEQACDIFCILICPAINNDTAAHKAFHENFSTDMFPFLLNAVERNVEWSKGALKCILTFMKVSPLLLSSQKDAIQDLMLKKFSDCLSSEQLELVASCFVELPNIYRLMDAKKPKDRWISLYSSLLNTLQKLLNPFIAFITKDFKNQAFVIDGGEPVFAFNEGDNKNDDVVTSYLKGASRYINLSKCLSKMLSSRSSSKVEVPVLKTLTTILQLFEIKGFKDIKPTFSESQVICSLLSQMQMASLVILESLIVNFNLSRFASVIAQLFRFALEVSKLQNISTGTVRQIREAVWKLMNVFIKKHGGKVSSHIINLDNFIIIHELLVDICIEDTNISEAYVKEGIAKSDKDIISSGNMIVKEGIRKVCKKALQTLEQMLYTGLPFFEISVVQEIFSKICQIASKLRTYGPSSYQFPYDDDKIRKCLYAVLLVLALNSNLPETNIAHQAQSLLKNASLDPSYKVTGLCNKAMPILNAKLNPKRPPLNRRLDGRQESPMPVATDKFHEWTSQQPVQYNPIENASKIHNSAETQPFHGHSTSSMQEDIAECMLKYPEEAVIQNENNVQSLQSSEIHEVDDDEDEEVSYDADEEEDEEEDDDDNNQNFEEEEIHTVEPEERYIPNTSKLQILTPVHISSEIVHQNAADQEYEQMRPCLKNEIVDNIKNKHLTGEHNIVPDENMPSSSTEPSIANENRVLVYDDNDDEEEEVIDDEVERSSFPAGKRVPTSYSHDYPPSKKSKQDEELAEAQRRLDDWNYEKPLLMMKKIDYSKFVSSPCTSEEDDFFS